VLLVSADVLVLRLLRRGRGIFARGPRRREPAGEEAAT
jgi:hypothetical protein